MIKEEENEDWILFHPHTEVESQHFHSLLSTPDHFLTPDFEVLTSRVLKENGENDMIDERDQIIFGPGIPENSMNFAGSFDHNTHNFELTSISQMLTSSDPVKKKRNRKSKKENVKEKKIVSKAERKMVLKIQDLWSFKIKNPNFFKN